MIKNNPPVDPTFLTPAEHELLQNPNIQLLINRFDCQVIPSRQTQIIDAIRWIVYKQFLKLSTMKKIVTYLLIFTMAALIWTCSLSACATAPCGRPSPAWFQNGKVDFYDPGAPFSLPRFFGHNTGFHSKLNRQTSFIIKIMLSTDLGSTLILRVGKNGKTQGNWLTIINQAGTGLFLFGLILTDNMLA